MSHSAHLAHPDRTSGSRFQRVAAFFTALLLASAIPVAAGFTSAHADPTGTTSFDAAPVDLDFGDVAVGDSETIDVVFTNTSTVDQSIDGTWAGGGLQDGTHFDDATTSADGLDTCRNPNFDTLAQGESCAWPFEFSPQSPGEHTDSTSISIHGQRFPITVTGTGTGEDPTDDPTEDPTEDPTDDPTEDPTEDPVVTPPGKTPGSDDADQPAGVTGDDGPSAGALPTTGSDTSIPLLIGASATIIAGVGVFLLARRSKQHA